MGKVNEQTAIGICEKCNVLYVESCPDCSELAQSESLEAKAVDSVSRTLIQMGVMRKNSIHAISDLAHDIVDDLIEKKLLKWS